MKKQITDVNEIDTYVGVVKQEQETAIYFTRNDSNCTVSTTDCTFINKMRKMVEKNPDTYKCFANINSRNGVDSYTFEFPIKCLSFRNRSKKTGRKFTEEEKRKIAERFSKNKKEKSQ